MKNHWLALVTVSFMACSAPDQESIDREQSSNDSTEEAIGTLQQAIVPNPHTEGYRVTWADPCTSNKLTLWVTKSAPDSVPDTAPVSAIVCQKNNVKPNGTGIETPEDVTALIYLNTATFNSACSTMAVNTLLGYLSTKSAGVENISHFGWAGP
jgi:hypothetical protein